MKVYNAHHYAYDYPHDEQSEASMTTERAHEEFGQISEKNSIFQI